jgi:hypothetical protein
MIPMSEDKEITLYDLDDVLLIPRPNRRTLGYYEDEIKRLNESLQKRHKEYMEMSDKLKKFRVIRLEKFRAFFMLHCQALNTDIDLLACRDGIASGDCVHHKTCEPRKDLIERLHLESGE